MDIQCDILHTRNFLTLAIFFKGVYMEYHDASFLGV